jgi:peptidoglycan/xylan/chitin deacetylase (PgdA/CDA1 family)
MPDSSIGAPRDTRGGVKGFRRVRLIPALIVALVVLVCAGAGGSAAAASPPTVRWASLRQSGQDLVWRAQLSAPFTAAGLDSQNETLCLLIQTVTTGALREQVCLTPARRHSALVALYGSQHKTIEATVTRPTATTLRAEFLPGAVGLLYRELAWQTQATGPGPACASASPCTSTYPSQGQALKLHTPRLVGCKVSGLAFVAHGPSRGRMVALTFDDGPWYDTPQFLNVLEHKHAVATFFEIGEQIATYGQGGAVERRMLRDGDMVGDHTWSHANVTGAGPFAASQIGGTAAAIRSATRGFRPCLFRAPDGAVSPALISEARSMGFTTIQWDVDPRDWSLPGTDAIYRTVVGNVHPGAIVIQHDGGGDRSETLAALPREIDTLRHEGYKFVTVTQLLGYRLIYK